MFWKRKKEWYEDSPDPLVRRIGIRAAEARRKEAWSHAFWEGGAAGARPNGNALAGQVLMFVMWVLGAVICAFAKVTVEEIKKLRSRFSKKKSKFRKSKIRTVYREM